MRMVVAYQIFNRLQLSKRSFDWNATGLHTELGSIYEEKSTFSNSEITLTGIKYFLALLKHQSNSGNRIEINNYYILRMTEINRKYFRFGQKQQTTKMQIISVDFYCTSAKSSGKAGNSS